MLTYYFDFISYVLELQDLSEETSGGRSSTGDRYDDLKGFFCMSCFHKSYTRWKLRKGIINKETADRLLSYSDNRELNQEQFNRRSAYNTTNRELGGLQNSRNDKWIIESFSDLTILYF